MFGFDDQRYKTNLEGRLGVWCVWVGVRTGCPGRGYTRRKSLGSNRLRRELITKPADDVQHLLAPEQVKVATARGLSLNDFGFQRSISKSVFPYSQIILAPSNTIQYLERSKWSKSLMLLDLSFNRIQTLPNETFWKTNFVNLKCLYLHNNLISEWDGILGLRGAPKLISLTMFGNSISAHQQYRHFMVNHFVNLICLDGNVVVDSEIIEGLSPSNGDATQRQSRFTPLNPATRVKAMYTLADKEYVSENGAESRPRSSYQGTGGKRNSVSSRTFLYLPGNISSWQLTSSHIYPLAPCYHGCRKCRHCK